MVSVGNSLLFGALALDKDFIDRTQFVSAVRTWVLAKATPLGEILLAQDAIGQDEHALLTALVDEHVNQFGGDSERSLAAVYLPGPIRLELEKFADAELSSSLIHVSHSARSIPLPALPAEIVKSASEPSPGASPTTNVASGVGANPSTVDENRPDWNRPLLDQRPVAADRHIWSLVTIIILAITSLVSAPLAILLNHERYVITIVAENNAQLASDERLARQSSDRIVVQLQGERDQLADDKSKLAKQSAALAREQNRSIQQQAKLYEEKQAGLEREKKQAAEIRQQIAQQQHGRALTIIDRGSHECSLGNMDRGIALFFHAYQEAAAGDPLKYSARLLMAAWEGDLGLKLMNDRPIYAVAFSPRDHKVLIGGGVYFSGLGMAQLWDATNGSRLQEFQTHDGEVRMVAFSHDGASCLTGTKDWTTSGGAAHIWSTWTGKQTTETPQHDFGVQAAALSKDDATLITAGWDHAARLWRSHNSEPIGEPLQHKDVVLCTAFSPDAKSVLTGSADKTARLWDAATGKQIGEPLRLDDRVLVVAFSPDGKTLFTGTGNNVSRKGGAVARLWNAKTGAPQGEPLACDDAINAAAFSPDGRSIVTASRKAARIWDVATGKLLTGPLTHDDLIEAVAYSPDSAAVATASVDKTARLWRAGTGRPIGHPMRHEAAVVALAFSPDGEMIATASDDGMARIWDVVADRSRKAEGDLNTANRKAVFGTGQSKITIDGKEAQLFDGDTPLKTLTHGSSVNDVAFSPDNTAVITASDDQSARLWDIANPREGRSRQLWHSGPVAAIAFSRDGRLALTGSNDMTAQLWDVATGQPIGSPFQSSSSVSHVGFDADGRAALAGSSKSYGREWDIPQPLPDEPAALQAWTEARTGWHVDEYGFLVKLTFEQWLRQRKSLSALGEPWNQWRGSKSVQKD